MEAYELLSYKGAGKLLATLTKFHNRQFSINELAKTADLPFTTAWKLVQKFERAQVVEVVAIGKSKAVKFKASPFSKVMQEVARASSSTQALSLGELRRILKAKEGIMKACLFGSVARKKEALESDVDVALLVSKKIDVLSIMSLMQEKYGAKLVPLVFDSEEEFDDFLKGKEKVVLV